MKDHFSIGTIGTGTLILALMLLLLGSEPALAAFYRYVDQNGATRYTDDLLEVPEAQRSDAKKIIGVQAASGGDVSAGASIEGDDKKESGEADQNDSKQTEYERLNKEKEALDKEFDALQGEREALSQDKGTMPIKDYNEKVRQLNEHIATYEGKRNAFQKVADAYNVQVKE